jgi:L-cysteine desulfidase
MLGYCLTACKTLQNGRAHIVRLESLNYTRAGNSRDVPKQYEQQRNVQQIQSDTSTSDEEKIKRLNEIMHLITEITIETLKYSIASIRTPDALVTEIDFIRDFLVNCDRKLYQEIRDRVIELRSASELAPIKITCSACSNEYEQSMNLDQASFFETAS